METKICPKTWMTESILVTLFCCLPFGIAGIVNAAKVNALFSKGEYERAIQASNAANKWVKIGFFIGLALGIISIVVYLVTLFNVL